MITLFVMIACSSPADTPTSIEACDVTRETHPVALVEVAQEWGLDFASSPIPGDLMIVVWLGQGACIIDYDLDGDQDLYLLDSLDLPNRLYENQGGTFVEVPNAAGANSTARSKACLSYDYDGDGDYDLYLGNEVADTLYRNDDGVFVDITVEAGIDYQHVTSTITAGDIDADGDLDLLVAGFVNYADCSEVFPDQLSPSTNPRNGDVPAGLPYRIHCEGVPPTLYVYEDGAYTKGDDRGITEKTWVLAGLFVDIDFDADLDLFLATDWLRDPSFLFINDGTGHFEEHADLWGLKWPNDPETGPAGMGLSIANIDEDEPYEIAISNWDLGVTTVFDCAGQDADVTCQDASFFHGQGATFGLTSWAVQFADFDQDFDQDLFVAYGASGSSKSEVNQLFFNEGGQLVQFTNEGFDDLFLRSRSANLADLDGDGDLDIVVTNINQPVQIYENRAAVGNYLMVELDTQAAGATVRVTTEQGSLRKFAYTGGSYLGSDDPRVHFGVADACSVDVEVTWIGGATRTIKDVPTNQVLRIERP